MQWIVKVILMQKSVTLFQVVTDLDGGLDMQWIVKVILIPSNCDTLSLGGNRSGWCVVHAMDCKRDFDAKNE